MTAKDRLTLSPRVSIFRHRGRVFIFDPPTRTYASMNESMLAFITNPTDIALLGGLSDSERRSLTDVTVHLRRLGILAEASEDGKGEGRVPADTPNVPSHLAIFVTTKCNLRCAYCYAEGGDTERTIRRDKWQAAMDYFFHNYPSASANGRSDRQYVSLAIHGGGEPTVEFSQLEQIVGEFRTRARAAGLRPSVGMGTNGTYGDRVHRWIIENEVNPNFSLDGPPSVQNRLRPFRSGRPTYDLVVHNIRRLIRSGRQVGVRATVTGESLGSMKETVETAGELGIRGVHFEPVSLTGRCRTSSIMRPDAEQFVDMYLRCFRLGLRLGVDVRYSGMRCFQGPSRRFCGACGQNMCITPDGNITSCYEVLDSTDPAASAFFVGRVDPIQGRVVLDPERIIRLQQRVAENMAACGRCFMRGQCAGDCPVKAFRSSNGDINVPDPYRCRITQGINRELIALIAEGAVEPRGIGRAHVLEFRPREMMPNGKDDSRGLESRS